MGKERKRAHAAALQLTDDEYRRLGLQLYAATIGLAGTKAERLEAAGRRLKISGAELALLRQALASVGTAPSARVRGLARHVIDLPALQTALPQVSPKRAAPTAPVNAPGPAKRPLPVKEEQAPKSATPSALAKGSQQPPNFVPAPKASPAQATDLPYTGRPLSRFSWDGDTNVYVIEHGNVVHAYSDCFGMRGFRHSQEPDPTVYQVNLRHPICASRRACRKCFDQWASSALGSFDDYIEALHGRREAHLAADRKGPKRKVVVKQGGKAKGIPRMPSPSRSAAAQPLSKKQKRARDAARLGISVDELVARRRAEVEASIRAKASGKAKARV